MPVELIAEIIPKNAGSFAMVEDTYLKGGFRTVANVAERGAIPPERFKTGMVLYQWDIQKFLQLDDSESWRVVPTGHTIVDHGSYLPFTNQLYFKGLYLESDEIDDFTLVQFPRQCTTAERIAWGVSGKAFAGNTLFDTDLQRLATWDGASWRII